MAEKKDIRIVKTKQKFRRALLDILQSKSLSQISVCEICAKAGVNRNTFYSHYSSAEELMGEVESDFTKELMDTIKVQDEYISSVRDLIKVILSLVRSNLDMCTLIFSEGGEKVIPSILQTVYTSAVDNWIVNTGMNADDAQMLYQFISGGAVSAIRAWIFSGFSMSEDDMADRLNLMILGAQEALIRRRTL